MNAEIHTLTGAYALDALSETERAVFEHHLAQCRPCTAEVAELQDTAARLGVAVSVTPPAAMKAQVLAAARRVRQLPPTAPPPAAAAAVTVIRPRWQLWVAGAAAAACFVAAVVFGVQSVGANHRVRDNDRQLALSQQQLAAAMEVLAAPDAAVTSASADGSSAIAVVSRSQGRVAVMLRGMPALAPGKAYQAWLMNSSGAHSVGVLAGASNPPPVVGTYDEDGGTGRIGVTVEQLGGSPTPTTPAVMEFELQA